MDFNLLYLGLAIFFGFLMAWGIGANDVSNAMGTSVGSKAITIKQAIIIAAVFEFLGVFIAGSEVTNTIKKDIVDITLFKDHINFFIIGMLSALLSAALWLFVASFFGWPVSTTHTIVGAVIGFGIAEFGVGAIHWKQVSYIIFGWLFSPILGGVLSYGIFRTTQLFIFNKEKPFDAAKAVIPIYLFITIWIITMISLLRVNNIGINISILDSVLIASVISLVVSFIGKFLIKRMRIDPKADIQFHFANVERTFAILMLFTACAMAFAHGSNDVANAIGPVAAISSLTLEGGNDIQTIMAGNVVPSWILFLGSFGIVLGLAMYGKKVISTVGKKITLLTPSRGYAATLAAAITVVFASSTGIPISTTHTLVGGIFGVGLARGIAALNLQVIRQIIMSWIITLPVGAALAIVIFYLLKTITMMFY